MFTGIIEETGKVKAVRQGSKSARLTVHAEKILGDLKTGDSINTNGVCLTVVSFDNDSFTADAMPETLRRSNLGELTAGTMVNLERALRLNDRLGGHIVSGHIDGTGIIGRTWEEDNAVWFTIKTDRPLLKYIVEKGSVAVDGISLTISRVDGSSFDVSIIPHTMVVTTLITRKAGEKVNIECDVLAKYIEKIAVSVKEKGNITMEFLSEQGFV